VLLLAIDTRVPLVKNIFNIVIGIKQYLADTVIADIYVHVQRFKYYISRFCSNADPPPEDKVYSYSEFGVCTTFNAKGPQGPGVQS
jgi:hypothetical protein